MKILQPPGWARAKGFSNGISCSGRLVFIAGQIGWTGQAKWEARDFAGQFRQALQNVISVLREAKGKPEHIVRLTWYLTSKSEYQASGAGIGGAWKEALGKNFPPSTLLYIDGLVDERAKVEIEVTAFVQAA